MTAKENAKHTEEACANARLIAAAPDLLAALENLVEMCQIARTYIDLSDNKGFEVYQTAADAVNIARDAIAKAKGGSA